MDLISPVAFGQNFCVDYLFAKSKTFAKSRNLIHVKLNPRKVPSDGATLSPKGLLSRPKILVLLAFIAHQIFFLKLNQVEQINIAT